jgi:hypothetical protein
MDAPMPSDGPEKRKGSSVGRPVDSRALDILSRVAIDGNKEVTLQPTTRRDLCTVVEEILVNVTVRKAHIRSLQQQLGRPKKLEQPLPDKLIDAVVERGLRTLDDRHLIDLARNAVALCDLADRIADLVPPSWRAVISRKRRFHGC